MIAELQAPAVDHDTRIAELRELRRKAREIYRDLKRDLKGFQQVEGSEGSFSTLPPLSHRLHVTTTCTALMALAAARDVDSLCPPTDKVKSAARLFENIMKAQWKSEGLQKDNAFTVALVLRLAGILSKEQKLAPGAALKLKHEGKTLEQIVKKTLDAATDFTDAFGVRIEHPNGTKALNTYPPKAAIVYWFVDGVDSLQIHVEKVGWELVARWATTEFNRQLAYVASNDDALMDPVSMAMAACLVTRLQKIMARHGIADEVMRLFPSRTALYHSISLLFKHQTDSGIWPKYFPMFHFLNAGANYCFTFEMLEALVSEMDAAKLFAIPAVLSGMNKAAEWCVLNRLRCKMGNDEYLGWNSGGSVTSLLERKPESWATATVHWFLHELEKAISSAIEHALLEKYKVSKPAEPDDKDWKQLADADVEIQSSHDTAKSVLERNFVKPPPKLDARGKIDGRRSALLFGPPGTAKTSIVRRLATAIGWPCVEIRPSDFLRKGLDNIYVVANEIFEDLLDLSSTVIFFDEMDALVQSRSVPLDVTRQFLTTSMLPKLAGLHDEGRSLFFVATNHRTGFDEAITRPGRFDLLLLIAPPSWSEKLNNLQAIVGDSPRGKKYLKGLETDEKATLIQKLRGKIEQWAAKEHLNEKLDRFTWGETASFLEELLRGQGDESSLEHAIAALDKDRFISLVQTWTEKYIILRDTSASGQNDTYTNFLLDKAASRLQ
jgi:SpoVK/Ycf46/Vps4 family AAA+-type ATPase